MGVDRFDQWGERPRRLDYRSRMRPARPHPRRRPGQPLTTVVRATAWSVVAACMAVAVPCVVFAGVGWWFDDRSTADAAWAAAGAATAAAVAAVPAVACHLRLVHHRPTTAGPAMWN